MEKYIHSKKLWKTEHLDKTYPYEYYLKYNNGKYVESQCFVDALKGIEQENIIPVKNLKDIVRLGQGTVSKWEKKGIIQKHKIVIEGGCKYQYFSKSKLARKRKNKVGKSKITSKISCIRKFFVFFHYDISEIRHIISIC